VFDLLVHWPDLGVDGMGGLNDFVIGYKVDHG
jgi:hypothetical protein